MSEAKNLKIVDGETECVELTDHPDCNQSAASNPTWMSQSILRVNLRDRKITAFSTCLP